MVCQNQLERVAGTPWAEYPGTVYPTVKEPENHPLSCVPSLRRGLNRPHFPFIGMIVRPIPLLFLPKPRDKFLLLLGENTRMREVVKPMPVDKSGHPNYKHLMLIRINRLLRLKTVVAVPVASKKQLICVRQHFTP